MAYTPNPDAARARIEDARRMLDAGVQRIQSSDEFKTYLKAQARFHKYSFGNVLLIMAQQPNATQIAGYRAWQAMGRQVRKGERGIVILAPLKVKTTDDDGSEAWAVRGFGTATVFDIAQTDGDALPAGPAVERLETASDRGTDVLDILQHWCDAHGLSLTFEALDGATQGYYQPMTASIHIESGNAVDQQVKTLLHEIAHATLHRHLPTTAAARELAEVQAEGVAFVTATALGLDTAGYSFGYIAGWQGNADTLRASATVIQQTAHTLIEQFAALPEGATE